MLTQNCHAHSAIWSLQLVPPTVRRTWAGEQQRRMGLVALEVQERLGTLYTDYKVGRVCQDGQEGG